MIDKIDFKGHLTIQALDKLGNIIDEWADNNMIMENARVNMSELISGMNTGHYINKIVFGTEGNKTGDYLTPKDETDGFVKERTQLFSEESGGFYYTINFGSTGVNGDFTLVSEDDSSTGESSNVNVVQSASNVTYTIDLPGLNGNNTGTVVYTEAALYAGTQIFSMKCFKGKIKDDSVQLRVVWTLKF